MCTTINLYYPQLYTVDKILLLWVTYGITIVRYCYIGNDLIGSENVRDFYQGDAHENNK